MRLRFPDLAVIGVHAVASLFLAQWVSRAKAGHRKVPTDDFLAGRVLPWWAIGASLIAANEGGAAIKIRLSGFVCWL